MKQEARRQVKQGTVSTRPARPKATKRAKFVLSTEQDLSNLVGRIERLEAICTWLMERDALLAQTSIRKSKVTKELSGPAWVAKFPGSSSLEDCIEPFRTGLKSFIAAMRSAGATVKVSATKRPAERAWLMHWAWKIAKDGISPTTVPTKVGIEIEWVHRKDGNVDLVASMHAAAAMVAAYGMEQQAALSSRHVEGRAVDMTISWSGALELMDASGKPRKITSDPKNGTNADLKTCGKTYGVIKIKPEAKDPPHWSDDGH